jgi:hypothetical protein
MKPCVILVDGMVIANRNEVAKAIAKRFPDEQVERYECDDNTPPHLYVHMMRDALEGRKNVVIENGWRADAVLEATGARYKSVRQFRRMLDRIALGVNAQIAYCTADSRTYAKNWALISPTTPYQSIAPMVERLEKAWDKLGGQGLYRMIIDTRDEGYSLDIDALMDRAALTSGINTGPGIGNWNPGKVVLLIGDRHGPSIQPYKVDYNLAFCDMAKAGSSYWLSDRLDEHQISEKHLYWINAFNQYDQATDPSFIERLRPAAVLSMGDIAARWCATNHIRHEPFSHPQYHKRFHFGKPYPLMERLKQITGEL